MVSVQSDPLVRTALWARKIAQTLKIVLFRVQDVTVIAAFITTEYKVSTLGGGGTGGGEEKGVSVCGPTHYFVNEVWLYVDETFLMISPTIKGVQRKSLLSFWGLIGDHLLETDERFHIRPSDNNMSFSLDGGYRKDLKQYSCTFKNLSSSLTKQWQQLAYHLKIIKNKEYITI